MTGDDVRAFLESSRVHEFVDFEPSTEDEASWHETLEKYWFRSPDWNPKGYRFVPVGQDGTGGVFAIWLCAGHVDRPVVFFGSEGGHGVLAPSPEAFLALLAAAPEIEEYPVPSQVHPGESWMLGEEDGERDEEAHAAWEEFKRTVTPAVPRVPAALQAEFVGWVASVTG